MFSIEEFRKKQKRLKWGCVGISVALSLATTGISPVFLESVKANTQDIAIGAEVEDEWYVSVPIIPVHQDVDNKYKTYEANISPTSTLGFGGTLSYDKRIAIDPFTTVTWEDANGVKEDIETIAFKGRADAAGTLVNEVSDWVTGEVVETGTNSLMAKNSYYNSMSFMVAGLTAGDWNGSVHLHISIKDAAMILNKDTIGFFTDDLDATTLSLGQTIIKDGTEYEILGFNPDVLTVMPNLERIDFTANSENTLWVIPSTSDALGQLQVLTIGCDEMNVKGSVATGVDYTPQIWLDNYNGLYLGTKCNFFFENDGSDLDISKIKSGIGNYTRTMRGEYRKRVNNVVHYDEVVIDDSYSPVPYCTSTSYMPSVDRLVIENSYVTQFPGGKVWYAETNAPVLFQDIQELSSDETFVHQWTTNCRDTLTTVELGSNVEAIGSFAFYGCNQITEIDIPDGTEYIGEGAFEDCTSLATVNIPSSVRFIEADAFKNTPWLNEIIAAGEVYKTSGGVVVYDPGIRLTADENGVCTVPKLITKVTANMIPDDCTKLQFAEGSLCSSVDLSGVTLESLDLTNLTRVSYVEGTSNTGGQYGHATNITGVTDEIRLNQHYVDLATGTISIFAPACNYPCRNARLILEEGVVSLKPFSLNHYPGYPDETFNIPASLGAFGEKILHDSPAGVNMYPEHVGYDMGGDSFQGFTVADGNQAYSTDNGVLYNDNTNTLVSVPKGLTGSTFTVKDGTENLGELSFSRNTNITKLVLPDSYIFRSDCAEFDPAVLNAGENSIHAATYIYNNIREYEVSDSNPNYTTINGCLYNKEVTTLLAVPLDYSGTLTMPNTVTTIADNAFGYVGTSMWDSARTPTCPGVARWYIYGDSINIQLPSGLSSVPDEFITMLNTGRVTATAPNGCCVQQMLTGNGTKWIKCADGSDPNTWSVQSIGKKTVDHSGSDHLGEITNSSGSVLLKLLRQDHYINHAFNIPVGNPYGIADVTAETYRVSNFTTDCWSYNLFANVGLTGAFTIPGAADGMYAYLTITIYDSGGNMITMTNEIAQYIISHIT